MTTMDVILGHLLLTGVSGDHVRVQPLPDQELVSAQGPVVLLVMADFLFPTPMNVHQTVVLTWINLKVCLCVTSYDTVDRYGCIQWQSDSAYMCSCVMINYTGSAAPLN